MPSRRPLHIRGPPESPCRSARQIRDDDDVYEVGIVHINKTVNEPELAKKLLSACQQPVLGMVFCLSLSLLFIYYFGPDWYISSTRFIMTFYSDIHSPRSFLVATQGFDFDTVSTFVAEIVRFLSWIPDLNLSGRLTRSGLDNILDLMSGFKLVLSPVNLLSRQQMFMWESDSARQTVLGSSPLGR